MAKFTYDAKFFTTITVDAETEAEAEKQANEILNRMTLEDPQNSGAHYGLDTEDGLELCEDFNEGDSA